MKLTSPTHIRGLLERLDLKPGKSMGQNFLVDGNILDIILSNAELTSADSVLEIGPGLGVVTEALIAGGRRVVAIEKDRKLYAFLKEQYSDRGNLELIHGDALDLPLSDIIATGITKVVSNLPYSVASRILVDIFKSSVKPMRIVVTLQTDVAERIAAPVGSREYGLLAILSQRFYKVSIVKEIGPNCFMPRPRVGSALMVCMLREEPLVEVEDDAFFLRLVKMAFTHRRKIILNSLQASGFDMDIVAKALREAGIEERVRPAELTVEDWGRLCNVLM